MRVRDFRLDGQVVGDRPLVGLRPELRLVARFDEARGDAHTRALAPHAALEQVVGAQRFADLARALQAAFEDHRRPSRQHAEAAAAQRAELRDHLLGQPVAEVLLPAVVAEID